MFNLKTAIDRLPALLRSIAKEASAPLYLVGGSVRDLLMDRQVTDYDLVVEGNAIDLARRLAVIYGGKVSTHARFGTAVWKLDAVVLEHMRIPTTEAAKLESLDLISARSEIYKQPAALPTIHLGTIIDDLRRRDFTINTLAIRLDGVHYGELRDDHGGMDDLEAGLVRVQHPRSFLDDPTRLFRAVRYEQRYGFKIAPDTLKLLPAAIPGIDLLSAQRVRHELDLILEEDNSASILGRLTELNIIKQVHPALRWDNEVERRFTNGMNTGCTSSQVPPRRLLGWGLWLMGTPARELMAVDKRVHFNANHRKMLLEASDLFNRVDSLRDKKPSQCTTILDEIPSQVVQMVYLGVQNDSSRKILRSYLSSWRHIKTKTTGHTLLKRGIPAGPVYQSILYRLRKARLDGEITTDYEEMELLEKLISA